MVQTHQLKDRDYQISYKNKIQLHAVWKNPLENKDLETFEVMEKDIPYKHLPKESWNR